MSFIRCTKCVDRDGNDSADDVGQSAGFRFFLDLFFVVADVGLGYSILAAAFCCCCCCVNTFAKALISLVVEAVWLSAGGDGRRGATTAEAGVICFRPRLLTVGGTEIWMRGFVFVETGGFVLLLLCGVKAVGKLDDDIVNAAYSMFC